MCSYTNILLLHMILHNRKQGKIMMMGNDIIMHMHGFVFWYVYYKNMSILLVSHGFIVMAWQEV